MSWEPYVTNLEAYQGVSQAALLAKDGSVMAKSSKAGPLLETTADELRAVVSAMNSPDQAFANGLMLHGKKYFVTQVQPQESIKFKLGEPSIFSSS